MIKLPSTTCGQFRRSSRFENLSLAQVVHRTFYPDKNFPLVSEKQWRMEISTSLKFEFGSDTWGSDPSRRREGEGGSLWPVAVCEICRLYSLTDFENGFDSMGLVKSDRLFHRSLAENEHTGR